MNKSFCAINQKPQRIRQLTNDNFIRMLFFIFIVLFLDDFMKFLFFSYWCFYYVQSGWIRSERICERAGYRLRTEYFISVYREYFDIVYGIICFYRKNVVGVDIDDNIRFWWHFYRGDNFFIKVKRLKSERGTLEVLSLLSVIFMVFSVNVIFRTFVNVLIGLSDFSL